MGQSDDVVQEITQIDSMQLERVSPLESKRLSGVFTSSLGSEATLDKKDLSTSQALDAGRLLQNKIGGLSVLSNSYAPGASTSMILRGYRSFNGNNQPLILLDGVPINNDEWNGSIAGVDQSNRIMDIDPNSIASLELIHRSADRAKYGIVGSNGVLLITTKKGYRSKPTLTYKTTIAVDKVSNLPALQSTYAPGHTMTGGVSIYRGPETYESDSWGPAIENLSYDGSVDYPFDKNGSLRIGTGPVANSYDPYEFFLNGKVAKHALQLTGGTQKFHYRANADMVNHQGVIPTSEYRRYNFSGAVGMDLKKNWSINLSGQLTSSQATRNQKGSHLQAIMLGILRTPSTFDNSNGLSDPLNEVAAFTYLEGNQENMRSGSNGRYTNPYWSLNKNRHTDKVNRQVLSISSDYSYSERLSLAMTLGLDHYTDSREGGVDKIPNLMQKDGFAYLRDLNFSSQQVDASVLYVLTENQPWSLSGTLGFNYNQSLGDYNISEGLALRTPGNTTIENAEILEKFQFSEAIKRSGSVLSLDGSCKNLLDFTASLRQDFSSKFGSEANGFLSYGLGVALSVSEILFPVISGVQERNTAFNITASYGKYGNQYSDSEGYGRYLSPTLIGGDGWIASNEFEGSSINKTLISENLTAEKIESYDVGFNFEIKQPGIMFSAVYYNESSSNLIVTQRIANSTGFTFLESNSGALENKGVELALSSRLMQKAKVEWDFGMEFNKNSNQVIDTNNEGGPLALGGFATTVRSVATDGHSYGAIYGSAFRRNEAGLIIVGDDGFPLMTEEDKVVGNPSPDWIMYINNTITIAKDFSLSASVDIKQGGDMYCGTCGTLDYLGKSQLSADERGATTIFEGVTEAGNPNTQTVELASFSEADNDYYRRRYGFSGLTEMNIYDASWLRLRSISIQYDIAEKIKLDFISELKLGVFGENLWVSTTYPGIDPETNLMGNSGGIGFDYYNNPGTKRYGLTLQAKF